MQSTPSAEHFVTLFDSHFLPQGLALAASLARQSPSSTLWVICVDEEVHASLASLKPPNVRVIGRAEIEDERLLAVKGDRTLQEYCWTLTAFSFDAVFERCKDASRVTYLDADLYFFSQPSILLAELEASGASVLITDHDFDPEYDKSETVGRFCVQFLTMDRSAGAREVRQWWQNRVLEWCYNRHEPGKFGDQKYLDLWPELFEKRIHILQQTQLSLAPWNVRMESAKAGGRVKPVFYHFHSFRLVDETRIRLVEGGYAIPSSAQPLYEQYVSSIKDAIRQMRKAGIDLQLQPITTRSLPRVRHLAKKVLGRADLYARIAPEK